MQRPDRPAAATGIRTDCAVVRLPAEIDLGNVGPVRDRIEALLGSQACALAIDASRTRFCDCTTLGMLVRALRHGKPIGVLLPSGGIVPRIFALTGLDRVFPGARDLDVLRGDLVRRAIGRGAGGAADMPAGCRLRTTGRYRHGPGEPEPSFTPARLRPPVAWCTSDAAGRTPHAPRLR